MNNLKELEQKYQELGQEIERLKKSEVKYPIYCRSKNTNVVVKFVALNEGVVCKQDKDELFDVGMVLENWESHTDTRYWEQLEVCPDTGFYDGQLVWCWENDYTYFRTLRFFDAINRMAFDTDGTRYGDKFDNYKPYEGNWPEWAQEAFKTLEK